MQPSVCLEWFNYISYTHSPAKYDGDGGNVRAGDIKLFQISNFIFNFAWVFVCKTSTNKNESKKTHIWRKKKVERKFQLYWKYIVGIADCCYYFIFFYLEMAESERALSWLFKYKSLAMRWWLVKDSIAIAIWTFSTFHSDILCVYQTCCKSFIFKYILPSER